MKKLVITIFSLIACAGFSNSGHAQLGLSVVSITAPDAIAAEGGDPGRFLVQRNRSLKNPLRVYLRVAGSAISGADYTAIPASMVIPAGRSAAQISIRPIDDGLSEGREKVAIHIVSPPGKKAYSIGAKSAAVVRIEDDDPDEPAELTVAPTASGNIVHLVEINEWFVDDRDAPIGAYYYRQMHGREFFRGFMEFQIPKLERHLVSATLKLMETTPVELVPTVHDIWHYPADLQLGTNDFYAPATLIGTFVTDPNIAGEAVNIEMTWSMRPYIGTNFGLRIKLAVDPEYQEPGWLGSRFAGVHESFPPHLLLRTTQRPYGGITSPSATSTLVGPTNIVIKAVAVDQDGFVSGASFWANGQKIGEQNSAVEPAGPGTDQRFSMTWVNVTPGTYVLEARTIDNEGAESVSQPVTITVEGRCRNEVIVLPTASGRIEFASELNQYQVNVNPAHNYDYIASVYHARTGGGVTRIFERGFLEFEIPALPGGIAAATLLMRAQTASSTLPNFIDTHEIWAYPADLSIDAGDYDRGTELAGTFQTEVADADEYITVDLTEVAKRFQGANLGLRIKLAIDPEARDPNYHGDAFHSARIVIVACP